MKKISLSVVIIMVVGCINVVNASGTTNIDIKKYNNIKIEKNISKVERKVYLSQVKDMGPNIKVIDNPTFACTDIGYLKSNLFEKGTLYGTKNRDGNVEVSSKGDFKVYSFVKYFKNGLSCIETTYEKADNRYAKGSFDTLRSMYF